MFTFITKLLVLSVFYCNGTLIDTSEKKSSNFLKRMISGEVPSPEENDPLTSDIKDIVFKEDTSSLQNDKIYYSEVIRNKNILINAIKNFLLDKKITIERKNEVISKMLKLEESFEPGKASLDYILNFSSIRYFISEIERHEILIKIVNSDPSIKANLVLFFLINAIAEGLNETFQGDMFLFTESSMKFTNMVFTLKDLNFIDDDLLNSTINNLFNLCSAMSRKAKSLENYYIFYKYEWTKYEDYLDYCIKNLITRNWVDFVEACRNDFKKDIDTIYQKISTHENEISLEKNDLKSFITHTNLILSVFELIISITKYNERNLYRLNAKTNRLSYALTDVTINMIMVILGSSNDNIYTDIEKMGLDAWFKAQKQEEKFTEEEEKSMIAEER